MISINHTSLNRLSYQAHDARGVNDPASVAGRVRRLGHELGASILTPKKDAAAIDTHNLIPRLFRHLVHHTMMLGTPYASVIDHTRLLAHSIEPASNLKHEPHRLRALELLTRPTCLQLSPPPELGPPLLHLS